MKNFPESVSLILFSRSLFASLLRFLFFGARGDERSRGRLHVSRVYIDCALSERKWYKNLLGLEVADRLYTGIVLGGKCV